MEVKGASAIVTGGAGGVGERVCLALAKAGSNVVVVSRSAEERGGRLIARIQEVGGTAVAVNADLLVQEDVDRMLTRTLEMYGSVDIMVNSVGANLRVPFPDLQALDEKTWRHLVDSNLTGPYLAMRTVGPVMKERGRGRIVNVTSIAGLAPTGSSMAYAVAKAALGHLTTCMAVALAPEVLVNAVAPGMMRGVGMVADFPPEAAESYSQAAALNRTTGVDDVVDAIMTFVRTDSITGQSLVVDAGRVYR